MIRSFKSKVTQQVAKGQSPKGFPADLLNSARRKLFLLDNATSLEDLRVPPANRLEALKGNRVGQYSIRVNDQYRLCFRWEDGHAEDVEFVDYH
ncbi:type II toxin-antitoxin system RelE/ParE family toxin [Rhizobium puerariae]|uniref:Type II toxin-antitoxin system RelE/ParE family toxin n=1 Tax=Rhizobium puerariae TaxID=1585791 RepID=A0ABV6AK34_9HYPH